MGGGGPRSIVIYAGNNSHQEDGAKSPHVAFASLSRSSTRKDVGDNLKRFYGDMDVTGAYNYVQICVGVLRIFGTLDVQIHP